MWTATRCRDSLWHSCSLRVCEEEPYCSSSSVEDECVQELYSVLWCLVVTLHKFGNFSLLGLRIRLNLIQTLGWSLISQRIQRWTVCGLLMPPLDYQEMCSSWTGLSIQRVFYIKKDTCTFLYLPVMGRDQDTVFILVHVVRVHTQKVKIFFPGLIQ